MDWKRVTLRAWLRRESRHRVLKINHCDFVYWKQTMFSCALARSHQRKHDVFILVVGDVWKYHDTTRNSHCVTNKAAFKNVLIQFVIFFWSGGIFSTNSDNAVRIAFENSTQYVNIRSQYYRLQPFVAEVDTNDSFKVQQAGRILIKINSVTLRYNQFNGIMLEIIFQFAKWLENATWLQFSDRILRKQQVSCGIFN